jgi:hypothetical protein
LKLQSDELLSNLDFNFNLRRYSKVQPLSGEDLSAPGALEAGAYTRPLFSST